MRREQGRDRVERLRLAARGALRRAGGAAGEDDRLARLRGRDDVGRVAALDQLLERRVLGLALRLAPGDVALAAVAGVGQHLGELLVVDDRLRLLAVGDVGELRAGERGVEEERVGPELRARDDRLDEAAVVAGHDRHVVALVDAVVGERVGERVRALLDLPERQLPELVDQRDLVGVARGGRLIAGGGRDAPADQADGGAERAVGPLEPDDPGLREGDQGLQRVGDLLRDGGHVKPICHFRARLNPPGSSPVSISLRMSPARRGLRNTWRWPTLGFSASRPAASSASPTSEASWRSLPAKPRARCAKSGVVAAPLAHPVEALEDPARDAAGGIGVLVGPARRLARAEQGEHGLLVVLDRAGVGGPAAEAADRLRDAQRVVGADRLAQRGVADHDGGDGERVGRAGGRCARRAPGTRAVRAPRARRARGRAPGSRSARGRRSRRHGPRAPQAR